VTHAPPCPPSFAERFGVSRESLDRLQIYADLLMVWQSRINLVSQSSLPEIWQRHVADSLQLLPYLGDDAHAVADLGSGAGFPGLALACARNLAVHLYESNGKKVSFLRDVIRHTGAKGVVHQVRLESLSTQTGLPTVQAVTARALAPLPELLDYAQPFLSGGAMGIFLKGEDVDSELTQAAKSWTIRYQKVASTTDSTGVILLVQEVSHVAS
jgi:16S rRNA (guanine527-N7)-methyltransferase